MDLSASILMRAIARKPVPRAPIWLMRQAGRYLPEYRQTRLQARDFMSLCRNKELACEVAMQPLRRFKLDAAILFSDILTIPDAMGLGLEFKNGEGPSFAKTIRTMQDVNALNLPNVTDDLGYVMDAVQLIREEMPKDLPLIGFSGSPWTLACYMVEGGSSKDFKHTIGFMYNDPEAMHSLLAKLAAVVAQYLCQQIASGANLVMLFDTWGGILSNHNYQDFSLRYMQQIVAEIKVHHPLVPVVLYTKGGGQWLNLIANSGCDVVGLDWTTDLAVAKKTVGAKVALQGNLDPMVLLSSSEVIVREVKKILSQYGKESGLIFNLGHGITPDVPPDNVAVMIDAVHDFYK
jgi:uroporphyrinogen decarboxylase